MGFPIRKSTGHRLFAPHRSLSQRTTSFIASCRQGIHRMLLGHLIALISNAHLRKAGPCEALCGRFRSFLLLLGMVNTAYRKTSLHRDRPKQSLRLASSYRTALAGADDAPHRMRYPMPSDDADCRPAFRAYPFFTMSSKPLLGAAEPSLFDVGRFLAPPLMEQVWWSQTGSNRRPPACKAGALPTELWPRSGVRDQG